LARILMLLGLVIVFGCGGDDDEPVAPPLVEQEGPTEVEMVAAMEAHYTTTILAHDALIQGDVDGFRAQLAATSSHELPPNSPELWKPFDRQLHAAARKAAEATDLDSAATGMAEVALACGACHGGVGAGPIYPAPAPRDGRDPLQEAMLEHQWATERLWEGVTGPWENAWERGSAALAETRVFGGSESSMPPDESLLEREAALRSLGEEAMTTKALDARARLYGRLLATCGDCHGAMGIELPPYE
jgi:cytochrome c553